MSSVTLHFQTISLAALTIAAGSMVISVNKNMGLGIVGMGILLALSGFFLIVAQMISKNPEEKTDSYEDLILELHDIIKAREEKNEREFKSAFTSEDEYNWIIEGRRKRGITRKW